MARKLKVAAAQMGPISRSESRQHAVARLLEMMREASAWGCKLIVFTELALTTFFPRWVIDDESERDAWFESDMPGPDTQALFDEATRLGIGFHLGYAELAVQEGRKWYFNTSILVDQSGQIIGKYRKIHIPGHHDVLDRPGQHLEKRYFDVGDLGFNTFEAFDSKVGMCICNDRRWPETWRVLGLKGAELVLCGYNSPVGLGDPFELDALEPFHNHLVFQTGCYQNATWAVGVAKAGCEEGFNMIGQSAIFAPSGEIVAQCVTMEDEVIVHEIDLDMAAAYKRDIFNFAAHRRPEHYVIIANPNPAGEG